MAKTVIALLGMAVLGAIFAGVYYAPSNVEFKERGAPAYQLGPGEVQSDRLQPTVAGTPILIEATVRGGPIDLYILEKPWAESLPEDGRLQLDRPFSYHAQWSRTRLNGTAQLALLSDGRTEYLIVLDNSDNYYDGDAAPDLASTTGGTVSVQLTIHFAREEQRSLVLGYLAATPSVLLLVLTLGRKARRSLRTRRERRNAPRHKL